jgi:hypothetical protein
MSKREHLQWKLSLIRANWRMAKAFSWLLFSPISYARMGSISPTGNNVPDKDKPVLLSHMNKTGLMWLDAKTFKKHKQTIPAEYAHLLGSATGMKPK